MCPDFKTLFKDNFNTYYSLCLQSAASLASVLATDEAGASAATTTTTAITSTTDMGTGTGTGTGSDSAVNSSNQNKNSKEVLNGMCSTEDGSASVIDSIFSGDCECGESDSNVQDVLEALLNSLCSSTDYGALSLQGESKAIMWHGMVFSARVKRLQSANAISLFSISF